MPKKKNSKTIKARGKGKRDKAVRSMTSSMASGATSVANSTINKQMRKPRHRKLDRGKALRSMASGVGSIGKSVSQSVGSMLYETGMPMIEEASKSAGQFMRSQRVPRVANNPSWEDLRRALSEGLINVGILDHGEEIPTPIYFQSVQKFLDTHKDVIINKGHIKRVNKTFKGLHPDNTGDATPQIMKETFKNGITHDSILSSLEYGFQSVLFPDMNEEQMSVSSSVPGQGFQKAKEKTSAHNKYKQVVSLASGIEILLGSDDKDKYYKSLAHERFKKLDGLITTEKELKVLQRLVKKYPELNPLAARKKKRKKKSKGKAQKKTGRKKR